MKVSHARCAGFLFLLLSLPSVATAQASREPSLIRDTDIAEGKETIETQAVQEPDPLLAAEHVNIGNYYLKTKNYAAAIQRFLQAIEYEKDSAPAYEGLVNAYEKSGEVLKAIQACRGFLEKNPGSPKAPRFRNKLAKLEKNAG